MCGICGIWNLNGRPATADEIRAMADMLAHRGPDAEGYYLDGPLALGHRRLAILDLTPTGNQPMGYANGRYWLTYNGEIYNFLELRAELEQKGYAFRSGSDTEVILAAYAAWGPECVLRFNGMWAFAIWDSLERRLFLARDRFGIKPLYYLYESDRFAFASEMKAFLRLAGFTPRANLRVLKAELLDVHSQEWGEDCLLIGIRRLPPGCYLQVGADGQIRTHKWWCTRDHLPDVPARFDEQVEHFRLLFEDACRLRLRSDVPIATCLSGGIDSSSVVCTLAEVAKQGTARIAPGWQRAFIASFPGAPVDERKFAETVVQKAGIVPVVQEIRLQDALPYTEHIVFHLEEIYTTPPWGLWLLYHRLRQEGAIVTLDGHGGDELLAGYDHYIMAALYDAGSRHGSLPRYLQLLQMYAAMRSGGPDVQQWRNLGDLLWDTAFPLRYLRRLLHPLGVFATQRSPDLTASWFAPDLEGVPCPAPERTPFPDGSLLERTLYQDFHEGVLQVILRNFDRMSMAHGVEIRMPFLDWRLVTFTFALPETSKVGGGFTKRILREAMKGRVPEIVRTRKDKIGFSVPVSLWMQQGLSQWLREIVEEQGFVRHPLWRGKAIADWVRSYEKGERWDWAAFSSVWRYVNAYLWFRTFHASL